MAVGFELDVPFDTIAEALGAFRGVERRMQLRGQADGVSVLDDYGHHPTEIVATLTAMHKRFHARTMVIFQPHRYSRTAALLEEFGAAFAFADDVIVTDIYPAGEAPVDGLDGSTVVDALARHGHPSAAYEPGLDGIAERVRAMTRPGDLVLTLGASDVWKVGEQLIRSASGGNAGARPRRSA